MDHFNYKQGELYAEEVPVREIAEQFGTPTYVYSKATLTRHFQAFDQAFQDVPHTICYAVKANSNIGVLQHLATLGAGFDIVSGGELYRALKAGADPKKIIFSGVGKSKNEIEYALASGIGCFNVESAPELDRIEQIAHQAGKCAPISIRVNPDVDAKTHPYISTGLKENKFGVPFEQANALYKRAQSSPRLDPVGIDCHIGSQLTQLEPFLDALELVLDEVQNLREQGIYLKHIDMGGGLGVRYQAEDPPHPTEYAKALLQRIQNRGLTGGLHVMLEPGRAIAANAGILLTQVEYLKKTEEKNFLIVDAAMNDLLRPALYEAWQEIITVQASPKAPELLYEVVGPVCETGDYLGKNRALKVSEGDLLAIRSAGAYGFSMSSNYNSRGRAAEILVDQDKTYPIRKREQYQDLIAAESLLVP